jgi:hypothetical protein
MTEGLRFVRFWADYMMSHTNKEWSEQQNFLINSVMKSASKDAELYLYVKKSSKPHKKR